MSAEEAARHWGEIRSCRLVAHRENAVHDLRLADGRRLALRLHRPFYQDAAAIAAELDWMAALAATGFPCPRPAPARDGRNVVALAAGGLASAVAWIDAAPLAAQASDPATFHALGRLIRRLHAVPPPVPFARPRWDAAGLLGPDPLWGRFWENPSLAAGEAAFLMEIRAAAARRLAEGCFETGAIHADLLPENVLRDRDGGLHLIDFDDCGTGYLAYDLGTALVRFTDAPGYPELRAALGEGYGTPADLDLFALLRALASAGWIASRAAPGDPRQRRYAECAVAAARAFSERR